MTDFFLSWLPSYGVDCNQIIRVDDNFQFHGWRLGGAEGSVRGQVYFLMYINHVFGPACHDTPFLFTDSALCTINPWDLPTTVHQIKDDLNSSDWWCPSRSMQFSVAKSITIPFKCLPSPLTSNLDKCVLILGSSVKDLGLDYSVNFSKQASYQILSANWTGDMKSRCLKLQNIMTLAQTIFAWPHLEFSTR